MKPLRAHMAQFNYVVGDMAGNADRIITAARAAYVQGARLLITPELSICAYAAEDLFLRPMFIRQCDEAVARVASALADLPGLYVVLGHPVEDDSLDDELPAGIKSVEAISRRNCASVYCEGRLVARYAKRELPNYQVFDERRYFVPGYSPCVFEVEGLRMGLLICEDAWYEGPARETVQAGAEVLLVINASPFHIGKSAEREAQMCERVRECGVPLIYAHLVGGQDEVVFEGRSFAMQADGTLAARAPGFVEAETVLTLSPGANGQPLQLAGDVAPLHSSESDLWHALVLGVRDYVGKNGFAHVVLGLSGGIDSALVLAIAVDALGADRVRAVMMPSPYTASISEIDAEDMAQRLAVRYERIDIAPLFETFKTTLAPQFAGLKEDTTEENLQARIRGTLLMALSNKTGALVLTTGNKSEMATGYCTLYGDMAGGFAVIKDVVKTQVFALARWRNAHDPYARGSNPIPLRIIERPPSAELRPDQKDQDSLPPYEVLDAIIAHYMENDESVDELLALGFDAAAVQQVVRLLRINEYKRRQAPVGIRVTHRSFGKDWRYPLTNRFRG